MAWTPSPAALFLMLGVVSCGANSSRNRERDLYAELALNVTAPPLKKECFFETGSWNPMCDPTLVQGLNGFFETLDSVIKKIERFHPYTKEVGLVVTIDINGSADGQGWTEYGPHAEWMDRVFMLLATKHGYTERPDGLNMKLACTRMLVLYDIIFPYLLEYEKKIKTYGELRLTQTCTETVEIGLAHRTASLKANLRLTVPPHDYEMVAARVRETGFTIQGDTKSP